MSKKYKKTGMILTKGIAYDGIEMLEDIYLRNN